MWVEVGRMIMHGIHHNLFAIEIKDKKMTLAQKKMDEIRVLHMVAGAGTGGAEMFSLDAIKALHDIGVKQHVICRDYAHYTEAFESRGISYDLVKYNQMDRITGKISKCVHKRIESFQPDLIQSWMGRASSFVPKNLSLPVLGWFGGYYKLKRYKHCDFYAGVSRDVHRYLVDETKTPEKCFLLHTFGTLEENAPLTREQFDIPPDAPLILLLSRMHWMKGVDTFLRSLENLDGHYALLAGNGPELNAYQKLARELKVEDRVRFFGLAG